MTNSQIFRTQFPTFKGVVNFFTSDCEQINFIDVPNDNVEFTTSSTASCGCCHEIDEREESLSHIMDLMMDDEFKDLCELVQYDLDL